MSIYIFSFLSLASDQLSDHQPMTLPHKTNQSQSAMIKRLIVVLTIFIAFERTEDFKVA